MIGLYSLRWSIARGAFWKKERDCIEITSKEWLKIFQRDEPNVEFLLSEKMPKMTESLFESVRPRRLF